MNANILHARKNSHVPVPEKWFERAYLAQTLADSSALKPSVRERLQIDLEPLEDQMRAIRDRLLADFPSVEQLAMRGRVAHRRAS